MKKLVLCTTLTSGCYMYHLSNLPKKDKINVVFDLDDTLIKSKLIDQTIYNNVPKENFDIKIDDEHYLVWVRPYSYVVYFLNKIANVHLFTAATQDYADAIIDKLYTPNTFDKKLYNQHWGDDGKDLLLVSQDNFILVDDKLYNQCNNQPFYHIPPYSIYNKCDMELIKVSMHIVGMYIAKDIKKVLNKE